jgi:hypothetical protein
VEATRARDPDIQATGKSLPTALDHRARESRATRQRRQPVAYEVTVELQPGGGSARMIAALRQAMQAELRRRIETERSSSDKSEHQQLLASDERSIPPER